MNQLIKIIYSLNDIDSSISFDPSNKISVFRNLINLTQKINLDEYQLFFGNKLISWDEEKSVKDLVGKELVPVFHIRKKGSPTKNRVIKLENKEKEFKSSSKTVEVFKTKLLIDFFPSRVEICSLLDKFYEENNLVKDFHVDHLGSSMEITFKNSDAAYDFTKKINSEKLNNPLYHKIKTRLDFEPKKKHLPLKSKSPEKKTKKDDLMDLTNILNTVQPKKNKTLNSEEREKISPKPLNSKQSSNIKIMRLISHLKDIKDEKVKEKIVKLYYSQASSLRTSVPYGSEKSLRFKEYLDNKKKWIREKGIIPTYRSTEKNFIPNDVNYNLPYGKPISEYAFRELSKAKLFDGNENK